MLLGKLDYKDFHLGAVWSTAQSIQIVHRLSGKSICRCRGNYVPNSFADVVERSISIGVGGSGVGRGRPHQNDVGSCRSCYVLDLGWQ